jgi:hypothetical protein
MWPRGRFTPTFRLFTISASIDCWVSNNNDTLVTTTIGTRQVSHIKTKCMVIASTHMNDVVYVGHRTQTFWYLTVLSKRRGCPSIVKTICLTRKTVGHGTLTVVVFESETIKLSFVLDPK